MINLYKRHNGKKYYIEFAFYNQEISVFIWECGLFKRIKRLDIKTTVTFELQDADAVKNHIEDLLEYLEELDS